MNQVRNIIARWLAKVIPTTKAPTRTVAAVHILDKSQLAQVAGGLTDAESPKGNW